MRAGAAACGTGRLLLAMLNMLTLHTGPAVSLLSIKLCLLPMRLLRQQAEFDREQAISFSR